MLCRVRLAPGYEGIEGASDGPLKPGAYLEISRVDNDDRPFAVPCPDGSLHFYRRGALVAGQAASVAVVRAFLQANAGAAGTKDGAGRLPIMYAIESGASPEVLQALLQAYPAAAAERDKRTGTFLLGSVVSAGKASPEVVQARGGLIRGRKMEKRPALARRRSRMGRMCLWAPPFVLHVHENLSPKKIPNHSLIPQPRKSPKMARSIFQEAAVPAVRSFLPFRLLLHFSAALLASPIVSAAGQPHCQRC